MITKLAIAAALTVTGLGGAASPLSDAGQSHHLASSAARQQCRRSNKDHYSKVVLASKPIAYYRLDERSGPVLCDASPAHLNGTYGPGITYGVPGPLHDGANTAVSSPGQSGDIAVGGPDGISGNHSFTLAGWFRRGKTIQNQVLADIGEAGKGNIAGLAIWSSEAPNTAGQICRHLVKSVLALDSYDSTNCWNTKTAGVNLWGGKWHYLALAYDASAGTITAYVDGKNLGSQTLEAGTFNLTSSPIRISNWVDNVVNQPFTGEAADIAVYPIALSATTIARQWRAAS